MEKINKHNYEAYFLDFAEGNLSAQDIIELNVFLDHNPELKNELDDFEVVALPNSHPQTEEWSGLKKPSLETLRADDGLRHTFYLRAVEKQLTKHETAMLKELVQDSLYKKEFALWEKMVLLPGNEKLQKDSFYQFGLDRAISEFNYDYFLIARSEGLLSGKQNKALENYAQKRPNGPRELHIADNLRLSPARGVFYPDKKALYKKEKAAIFVWFYRAATIAAVLLLGVFIWNQYQADYDKRTPLAKHETQKIVTPIIGDSLNEKNVDVQDSLEIMQNSEEPDLQEWEVREPDVLEYAESNSSARQTEEQKGNSLDKTNLPEKAKVVELENLTAEIELPELQHEDSIITTKQIYENNLELEDNLALEEPNIQAQPTYKTIPELAEDMLAHKLSIPDSEKDEMALVMAKRLTTKAGELLDTEYRKESSIDDESLTYTLRIGGVKFSRTRSK